MKAAKVQSRSLNENKENKSDLIQERSDKATSPTDDTVHPNLYRREEIDQSIRLAWDKNSSNSSHRRGSIYTKKKL